jgi:hypothetical protein
VTASARFGPALLAFGVLVLRASTARGWASPEHQQIGRAAYLRACTDLGPAAAARSAAGDAGVGARFEYACGRNMAVLAGLYGDATAIAGDFLSHPSEFLSESGAWRFSSKKHYLLLALENSSHFNPMATRSWAEYHERAVDDALAASREQGVAGVLRLQLASHESAFADHFLQDSFAAGHMGFNRRASSAAAAKSFHDAWNARGRVVTDRSGNRWTTYGDEHLDDPANADGRTHVMDVAARSVRHVLQAYVLGERRADEELAIWDSLPFAIEAPELLPDVAEVLPIEPTTPDRQLVPLLGSIRPARKDFVGSVTFWSAAPFEHPGDAVVAGVAGVELALPFISAQTYLGAGGTVRQADGSHSGVVDTGLLFPIALSVDGLLSHEVNATASWIFFRDLSWVLHIEYQLNVELGDFLLNAHAGLAELLPDPHTGWYGALGIGWTFSAAGGGSF